MIPMTVQGAEKLRKELDQLRKVRRPQIIASIADAREHGDLKENAEYQAAREQQSFCEGRIRELEYKLAHAQVIDITKVPSRNRVLFGTTVTLLHHDSGDKYCYRIVGDDEADSKNGLISVNSPIARGLINKSCDSEISLKLRVEKLNIPFCRLSTGIVDIYLDINDESSKQL